MPAAIRFSWRSSIQFFMLGLYAVLITSHDHSRAARADLDNFIATVLRSVEAR
jgi:hypothetical protein